MWFLRRQHFTLKEAVEAEGQRLVGKAIWEKYHRWPVYSKFFDNMGPIMHHLHQSDEQAQLVGRQGKPEGYYFPPQQNATLGNFPHTYFGLEPGTTREQIRACLEAWDTGDNGILDYSKAYRLKPGTGWLVPPRILHAPGSLLTYEPQWGSDVLAMFQSMVEARPVPRSLLTQDVPEDKHWDFDFLADLVDYPANLVDDFKNQHYLEPIPVADTASEGYVDRWIVYGTIAGAAEVQRPRTHRRAGSALHPSRPRCQRHHRHPGPWTHRQARCGLPVDYPLRADDPGRSVHFARSSRRGRDL